MRWLSFERHGKVSFGYLTNDGEGVVDVGARTDFNTLREAIEADALAELPVMRKGDLIEKQQFETLSYRPRRELFHYPLGAVVVLSFLYHVVMFLVSVITERRERVVGHA